MGPPFWWALSGILGAAAEAVNTAGFNRPTITCVNLDDKICCCYHVSLRKLVNFARRERLQRASQMSQCLGAGTGCGWCIPILKKIYEESKRVRTDEDLSIKDLPATAEQYAESRKNYLHTAEKNTFEG